jgi:hypothetical protein
VRDDVVDVPGDPFAFPRRGRCGRLGQPAGAFFQHGDAVAAGAHTYAEGVGDDERQGGDGQRGRSLLEEQQD